VTDGPSWLNAIGQIFHVIPDLATPEQVQASLREILDDPNVELFWWSRERGGYVDVHEVPRTTLAESPDQVVTLVEYDTRKVGAIAHQTGLLERPEFLETLVPTMRIAMERDRLHQDLLGKIEELRASRLRMVTAGDAERRRLERNLHDGAQQRLIVALLGLRRLEQQIGEDPDVAPLVRTTREELEGAIEDLRELARGLHPPLLARRVLAAAVRAASARSSMPIELDLRLDSPVQPVVEAAAYYVCAEAVTNAVKHAQASRAWLSIVGENGTLTVEVRDDGVGGACIDCDSEASGLSGLRDRVEALQGTLEVDSPPGSGTRLVATFPVRSAEATSP
jgi:signal transduction histidine kinase